MIDNKDAPPKKKFKHLNTNNYSNINNKISGAKSEVGKHKKHSGKKGNKNDTKSEMPNKNKLRLKNKSEISGEDENEIEIKDDLTSEIIESKIGHKRKDIKNGKKSQKTSEVDLLKNTKSSDNLVSNIKSSSKKK